MSILIFFSLAFFIMFHYNLIDYRMDMKQSIYSNPFYASIIPFILTFCLIKISAFIFNHLKLISKLLIETGENSLQIMYLHTAVSTIIGYLISKYFIPGFEIKDYVILYVFLGIIIPLLFTFIINKFYKTKLLFTGCQKALYKKKYLNEYFHSQVQVNKQLSVK